VILLISDILFLCQVIIAFTVISLTEVSMNKILDVNTATSDSVFDVTLSAGTLGYCQLVGVLTK